MLPLLSPLVLSLFLSIYLSLSPSLSLLLSLSHLCRARDGTRDLSGGDRDFAAMGTMGQADYGQVRGGNTDTVKLGRELSAAPLSLLS
jgi:hypothetical protein